MKKYDVIIVGAGPSGFASAKILKDNNINFCVIDKSKFPREKLCGGGLTNKSLRTLKRLNTSIDNIKTNECTNIDLIAKNINKNMILDNKIIMIDRKEFDYNNIKTVTNNNFFEEEKIVSIDNNILATDKDTYEFKYIIFSDGVNGFSRKFIDNRQFGFCVEFNSNKLTDKTIFDFCAVKDGYGWIFPKEDYTNIGLGNFNKDRDNYKELLNNFAKKYNFEIDEKDIKGYPIPIYSKKIYKNSVIDNKYILVGDAASLVDPVSGEGIYYALLSGIYAAESIIKVMNDSSDLKTTYLEKSKCICKALNKRNFVSKLLYSKCGNFFIKRTIKSKKLTKYINRMFG